MRDFASVARYDGMFHGGGLLPRGSYRTNVPYTRLRAPAPALVPGVRPRRYTVRRSELSAMLTTVKGTVPRTVLLHYRTVVINYSRTVSPSGGEHRTLVIYCSTDCVRSKE